MKQRFATTTIANLSLVAASRILVPFFLATRSRSTAFAPRVWQSVHHQVVRMSTTSTTTTTTNEWNPTDQDHVKQAQELGVWPLDESNAALLTQVHPRNYPLSTNDSNDDNNHFDLLVIGAGAGGLVSSRQAARRGAKSCMISEHLAGGDCLNVGCVPSKALLKASKVASLVKVAHEYGVNNSNDSAVKVDFEKVMARMRKLRSSIAPVDSHKNSVKAGSRVFQGRGVFVGPNKVKVVVNANKNNDTGNDNNEDVFLTFDKAVVATGGRPTVPGIPGLKDAPYTTNESLFNLQTLPPRMVIIGAGVIALEMAQAFGNFGSKVTVIQLSDRLFTSRQGDAEAAQLLQSELENSGVKFVTGETKNVETLQSVQDKGSKELPLLKVSVELKDSSMTDLECECLLVATGRASNVDNLGLEEANIEYTKGKGIHINDLAQCDGNPNVYAVGDCAAGVPRLTHVSGEMAKLVVQNALFKDDWKVSSLVIPAVMYTEPEYATVGIYSEEYAEAQNIEVDTYKTSLEHNDRAILEGNNIGFCKIFTKQGTDEILGAVIVAERAGEIINEVTLAMKYNLGLRAIGRNIHAYPTTGECVMMCGVQYINSKWQRFDEAK